MLNKTENIFKKLFRQQYILLMLVAFAGIAISTILFFVAQYWDQKQYQLAFNRVSEYQISQLWEDIEEGLTQLESVSAFYAASAQVTRKNFHDFIQPFLAHNHSGIQAFAWIPRVPDTLRSAYEKTAQRDGFPRFQFTERRNQGLMARASRRSEYFPVYFVEPYAKNVIKPGFDLATEPALFAALVRARDTGAMTATSGIVLMQESGTQPGYLIFQPLYRRGAIIDSIEARRKHLTGFALVIFGIGEMMEKSLSHLKYQDIDIYLIDETAQQDGQSLYSYPQSSQDVSSLKNRENKAPFKKGLYYAKSIDVGGRAWTFLCLPAHDYPFARRAWRPWGIMGGGLAFTGFLTVYILLIMNRTARTQQLTEQLLKSQEALEREADVRAQTEQTLRASEEKFRQVVSSAMDAIMVFDAETGQFIEMNKAAEEIYGYSRDELLNMRHVDISAEKEASEASIREIVSTGKPVKILLRYHRKKDGAAFPVEMSASIFMSEERQMICGITRDITLRKQAEEMLKESENRYKRLIESVTDYIYTVHVEDGRPVATTHGPGCLSVTGFTVKEYESDALLWYRMIHEDDRDAVVAQAKRVLSGAEAPPLEYRLIHKDSSIRWVRNTAVPRYDSEGCLVAYDGTISDITERKRAEEALRRSNEFSDVILNSMYDAVSIIDVNTRKIIKANSTFLENHGLSEDDVIGKTCHEITHHLSKPCSSSGDPCPLEDAIMTGKCSFAEHMHYRNNGEMFYVDESVSPIKNEINEVSQVVHVSRDITNRKLTMEALRESEERYRRLVELSPDTIFIQCEGRIVFINRAGIELFGAHDSGQLLRRSMLDLVHPDYREIVNERIRQLKDNQTSVPPLEEQYLRLDGTPVDVEVVAAPFVYCNKLAAHVIARDITDRKVTAEALRQGEERFRQIFEQGTDALFLFKAETGEIIDVNPAAVNFYGYTREEFIGHDTSLILEHDEYAKYSQALADSGTIGRVRIDQLTTMKKDGTKAIVSVWGYIVRLKESEVFTCSFRDITEKVRLEEEAKLIQAKLIQTNKMTSLGTLVSGVAHEINNPNNYISFNAQLLSDIWQDMFLLLTEYGDKNAGFLIGNIPFSEMREIVPKLLKGITEGSQRINNIVNNLKDYARKDSAGVNDEVDIHKAITTAASLLSNQIRKHAGKFDLDLGRNMPPIKGNAQQLEQVLVNLITNALQALADREGGIGITTFFDEEKRFIIIQIKDEGAGMSREVLDRIPEPFFTTKLAQGGTGLGLSISNSIIKDHRGALKFESEPGKGTIVTVILPVPEGTARKD